MNSFIIHYASGEAFFVGIFLLILSVFLSFSAVRFFKTYLAGILCALGAINIIASAIPLFLWIYIPLFILIITQLICGGRKKIKKKYRIAAAAILVAVSLLALGLELPFWFSPAPVKLKSKNIFVVGDSISAGTGFKNEKTWSEIIADKCKCNVFNKSVGGGTVSSAVSTFGKIKNVGKNGLVILEIGGNNLLNGTSIPAFRKDLEKLLKAVSAKTANVIMLELPLPPFGNGFGKAQRDLSAEFNVVLIPRRCFAAVFAGAESTTDGLHLSNYGQEKMAEMIMEHISK